MAADRWRQLVSDVDAWAAQPPPPRTTATLGEQFAAKEPEEDKLAASRLHQRGRRR